MLSLGCIAISIASALPCGTCPRSAEPSLPPSCWGRDAHLLVHIRVARPHQSLGTNIEQFLTSVKKIMTSWKDSGWSALKKDRAPPVGMICRSLAQGAKRRIATDSAEARGREGVLDFTGRGEVTRQVPRERGNFPASAAQRPSDTSAAQLRSVSPSIRYFQNAEPRFAEPGDLADDRQGSRFGRSADGVSSAPSPAARRLGSASRRSPR